MSDILSLSLFPLSQYNVLTLIYNCWTVLRTLAVTCFIETFCQVCYLDQFGGTDLGHAMQSILAELTTDNLSQHSTGLVVARRGALYIVACSFFSFRVLPSGVATADHLFPFRPVSCILVCHIACISSLTTSIN